MNPYPLTFDPILKPKVWGGRTLEQFGKRLPKGARIGESWEVADVTEEPGIGQSVICNGALAGMTLRQALELHGEMIMGRAATSFPLLIKYLDAHENLSVQVHPSESYVARHPETSVKHEAWVILRAEPGSMIYRGLKSGVTREQLLSSIAERRVPSVLNAIEVQEGQCYYFPSGTIHALGAGVALAEIQTSSDWTFRLYDWGREDTPERRELHIEQALECIDFENQPSAAPEPPPPPVIVAGLHTYALANTPHFAIERMDAMEDTSIDIVTSGIPEIWMTLFGRGQIELRNEPISEFGCGMTLLMPAALSELEPVAAQVRRGTSILRISLPSRITGMIA